MFISGSELRILGDTRAADQVVRISKESGDRLVAGEADNTIAHEWIHYFQFSVSPTGILLSQYRRTCMNTLLEATVAGASERRFEEFLAKLDRFRRNWSRWPHNWYSVGQLEDRPIESARLDSEGELEVQLVGLDGFFRLPVGVHQIFESWAWVAAAIRDVISDGLNNTISVPRDAASLVYTWPFWCLAHEIGCDIESLDLSSVFGLMPLFFITSTADHKILSFEAPRTSGLRDIQKELARRNITMGRLFWQLLRDLGRTNRSLQSPIDFDRYLQRIGVPSPSVILRGTRRLLAEIAQINAEQTLALTSTWAKEGKTFFNLHLLAEADILEVSIQNIDTVLGSPEAAYAYPFRLTSRLIDPVCAIAGPRGYQWGSAGFGTTRSQPYEETNARILLREQLSIMEHFLMKLAFTNDLACYGADWPLPIDPCEHAHSCMSRTDRSGLAFCEDVAWRRKVASLLRAVEYAQPTGFLSESSIPGITRALKDLDDLEDPSMQDQESTAILIDKLPLMKRFRSQD